MGKMLITRPEHDPATRYLSCWNKAVIKLAEKKGIDVIDLRREKANKNDVAGRIKKTAPALVVLNGHGGSDFVMGHNNEVLIKKGRNEKLLKGRIIYSISCRSAKKLGPACSDDETAYIGYDEDFVFNISRRNLTRPLEDKRAAQFLDAATQVSVSLIKGHTAGEASEISKNLFKEKIKELLSKGSLDPDARDDAAYLYWDMKHQKCLGNGDKRL